MPVVISESEFELSPSLEPCREVREETRRRVLPVVRRLYEIEVDVLAHRPYRTRLIGADQEAIRAKTRKLRSFLYNQYSVVLMVSIGRAGLPDAEDIGRAEISPTMSPLAL